MKTTKVSAGERFGRLTVIDVGGSPLYLCLCQCDCGNTKHISKYSLFHAKTFSCGCLHIENHSLPPGQASYNRKVENYRRHAKDRGLAFDITLEEFKAVASNDCHYCGSKPLKYKDILINGVDRIDNSKGYFVDNIVACCKTCNWYKNKASPVAFLAHVKRIYVFQMGKEPNGEADSNKDPG